MSWLEHVVDLLGVPVEQGYGPPTAIVTSDGWHDALLAARDELGCSYFDFLGAVDALDEGIDVIAHLADLTARPVRHLLLRARVPLDRPRIACVCDVFAGAGWHERETHEMFGIGFDGHGRLDTLLLPDGFEGHPLRKSFVLAARVARAWPGAKEPGESETDASPSRRRTRPPGVPEPGSWPHPSD